MYRLMIVDDDIPIREHIKAMIPFEDLDICCVGDVGNSEEALALFEQEMPHIVLVDIHIPHTDGLTLSKSLLELDPDVQLIMITGYGSLDYAREAIKAGIADFLLKPIDVSELETALRNAVEQLSRKAAEQARIGEMEMLVQEGLPLLRERYLVRLLNVSLKEDDSVIAAHLDKLGIPVLGTYFFAAVLSPSYHSVAPADWAALQIALTNIIQDISPTYHLTCTVLFDAMFRGIVFAQGNSADNSALESLLARARDKIQLYFPFDFYAGIGQGEKSLSRLHLSYRSALTALDYHSVYGRNNIANIRDVLLIEPLRLDPPARDLEDIIAAFKNSRREEVLRLIREYMSRALFASQGSALSVKRECIKLLSELLSSCGEVRHETEKLFSQDPYEILLRCEDPLSAQRELLSLVEELLASLSRVRASRGRRVIEQAKEYIEAHYPDPELRLDTVSAAVRLSSVYFCSLFKEETGLTFVEYLNNVRIEKAKALLLTTKCKIYEAALRVGYANPSYFFEIFKKVTGMRPREFVESSLN